MRNKAQNFKSPKRLLARPVFYILASILVLQSGAGFSADAEREAFAREGVTIGEAQSLDFQSEALKKQGLPGLIRDDDPRAQALDIFSRLKREEEGQNLAPRLTAMIRLYRRACVRLSDYQVFQASPNLYDLKVKCAGAPLYGLTVAANGYGAVYGGNGMISGLDSRDGLVQSFDNEGHPLVADQKRQRPETLVIEGTNEKAGELGYILSYLAALLGALLVAGLLAFIWLRILKPRRRKNRRFHHLRPMGEASSDLKDQLQKDAQLIKPYLYRHERSGLYIAIGPRGKRRFFNRRLWAEAYRRFGWHLFERFDLPKAEI